MDLPHKVGTLLYFFDENDELLLMERKKDPNKGLWSPPGGKVNTHLGESPFDGALREAEEETGMRLKASELHLAGFLSEEAYEASAHWYIFLFEVKIRLPHIPPPHPEGFFKVFPQHQLLELNIPETDRKIIYPLLFKHRGGFFSAHCKCQPDNVFDWTTQQIIK